MFRQMGIVLALGLTFIAFEYSSADVSNKTLDYQPDVIVEIDHMPITHNKVKLPPPPSVFIDKIIILPKDLFIEEELDISSMDIDDASDELYFPEEPIEVDPDEVFIVAEQMPEFPGGYNGLMQYLKKNVSYPSIAMEMGIQGRVYVEFIIDKTGKVTQLKIMKGVDRLLDNEALRVIQKMPKWEPGYQGGKAVNVSYRLPVNFVLQ